MWNLFRALKFKFMETIWENWSKIWTCKKLWNLFRTLKFNLWNLFWQTVLKSLESIMDTERFKLLKMCVCMWKFNLMNLCTKQYFALRVKVMSVQIELAWAVVPNCFVLKKKGGMLLKTRFTSKLLSFKTRFRLAPVFSVHQF